MKEIAQLAGVSIGTVDRVLHHRGRVSADNVAKINAIVAERGYRPNVFASRLSGGNVRTIAVLVPQPNQDYGYWQLLWNGMERAARELEPLHVAVRIEGFDRHSSDACAAAFHAVTADGCQALALAPIHSRVLKPLVEALPADLPLVFFDTDMECSHARCFVGQDPFEGGALAGKLLGLTLEPGRPVVLVRFDEDDEHLQKRSEGFAAWAKASGRQVLVLEQKLADPLQRRRADTSLFLAQHPAAGGLFVPNASVGEFALAGLGRRVVGYDLIPGNIAALREGRLDFLLSQRPEVMGYEAVRRLSRSLLFHEALPQRIGLPLDVILRENLDGHLEGIGWS
jgi:LacI family transcriptional regulator